MKSRQSQLDVTKMPVALHQSFATGFAETRLARNSHARIKRSISNRRPIFRDVVQVPIAYFKNGLIQYVLSGSVITSARRLNHSCWGFARVRYPKSQFFYALGHMVDDLLFNRFHSSHSELHQSATSAWLKTDNILR